MMILKIVGGLRLVKMMNDEGRFFGFSVLKIEDGVERLVECHIYETLEEAMGEREGWEKKHEDDKKAGLDVPTFKVVEIRGVN